MPSQLLGCPTQIVNLSASTPDLATSFTVADPSIATPPYRFSTLALLPWSSNAVPIAGFGPPWSTHVPSPVNGSLVLLLAWRGRRRKVGGGSQRQAPARPTPLSARMRLTCPPFDRYPPIPGRALFYEAEALFLLGRSPWFTPRLKNNLLCV